MSLQALPGRFQSILFSPRCWACGTSLGGRKDFCFSCRKEILRALQKEACLLRYEGAVMGLLACLRGEAPRLAASWCLALLHRAGFLARWRSLGLQQIVLAPQNSSLAGKEKGLPLLGLAIARELRIPLSQPFEKLGRRTQHGKDLGQRMDTPCFVGWKGSAAAVKGKRILLLDDVHTTGTTLDLCAYLLRKAEAEEIICFSLARQMMPSLERKHGKACEERQEVDPLLLHLFV